MRYSKYIYPSLFIVLIVILGIVLFAIARQYTISSVSTVANTASSNYQALEEYIGSLAPDVQNTFTHNYEGLTNTSITQSYVRTDSVKKIGDDTILLIDVPTSKVTYRAEIVPRNNSDITDVFIVCAPKDQQSSSLNTCHIDGEDH